MNSFKNISANKKLTKDHLAKKRDSETLFVGGFSCSTTHFEIKQIFLKYGPIKKIKMIKNRKGGSKGYCFIIFKQEESVQGALRAGDHWCQERKLSCRPILRGDQLKAYTEKIDGQRICCSNLPSELGEAEKEELKSLFEKFGLIENFYFALSSNVSEIGSNRGQSKFPGIKPHLELYISFGNAQIVEKILQKKVYFKGNLLKIKKFERSHFPKCEENQKKIKAKMLPSGIEEQNSADRLTPLVITPHTATNGQGIFARFKLNQQKKHYDLIEESTLKSIILTSSKLEHSQKNLKFSKKGKNDQNLHHIPNTYNYNVWNQQDMINQPNWARSFPQANYGFAMQNNQAHFDLCMPNSNLMRENNFCHEKKNTRTKKFRVLEHLMAQNYAPWNNYVQKGRNFFNGAALEN